MKATGITNKIDLRSIFVLALLILVSSGQSQTYLPFNLPAPYNASPYLSAIVQYDFGTQQNLGIGIPFPEAKFHIKQPLSSNPVFTIDCSNEHSGGYIKHLFYDADRDTTYSLFQSGTDLTNYFQGRIGCQSSLFFNGSGSSINISNQDEGFSFHYTITPPGAMVRTPLKIKYGGIKVEDLMECNRFRLNENAGNLKVLVSDDIGNGTWTNASIFNDNDWLETGSPIGKEGGPPPPIEQKSLHLNSRYLNVGIGTPDPVSKLHVMDGNILISRSRPEEPGSVNGSILFGDVISDLFPLGEWGIEYYRTEEGYTNGGLNFWKVESEGNARVDNCLFLMNTGNVGIGNSAPMDKFQVNDGINKVVMGIGTSDIYDKERLSELKKNSKGVAKENPRMINSALGYLGFNMVNTPEGWLVSGDGEHNYGSSIFHDFRGSMHFCIIPDSEEEEHGDRLVYHDEMYNKIKMSITSSSGYVGIGTKSPIEQLDVET